MVDMTITKLRKQTDKYIKNKLTLKQPDMTKSKKQKIFILI